MVPAPVSLGLTLCHEIIVERDTGNISLVNTFTKWRARRFPSPARQFCLFAVLSEGHGNGTMEIGVTRVETEEVIFSVQQAIHFPNRLAEVRLQLRNPECSFPAAGEYYATLAIDGEWVAQRRFRVILGMVHKDPVLGNTLAPFQVVQFWQISCDANGFRR